MRDHPVYLDHHATTPVDPRVVEAMLPFFSEKFGNASSRHHPFGWEARDAVAAARKEAARVVGADPREIVFTSGATESDNLAVRGVVTADERRPAHVVTMTTEHHAILDPCRRLEREGVEVTYVPPLPDGLCDPAAVAAALRPHTRLVSVMAANNEIGVVQPITEIAELTRARGILLHTDAAQAVGKIPIDVDALGVDLLSFTAHKFCGPKGIGALYVRRRRRRPRIAIAPLADGGGQEKGLRSGTLNVPGIVGFGAAAAIVHAELADEAQRVGAMRDRLLAGLRERLDGVTVNGSLVARVPHNLNVSFDGIEGESLLVGLDDIAVSSGAACTTANPEPSHVLAAIGVPARLARASVRFGLGRTTTVDEIDYAVEKVASLVARLRQLAPAGVNRLD